jgi:site-specific DNA-methyltransferase (adenine-specific)
MQPYYRHNGVTIYHADCLQLLPALPAGSVDLVLTDPPYLVGYQGRWDGGRRVIAGDRDPAWLRPAFAELWRLLRDDTFCVSFYGWPHSDLFVGVWKELGFRPVSHLAFVKNVWGLGRFTRGQHETAFLLAKGNPPLPRKGISDVIEWQREQDAFHPNQKPVGALYPLLTAYAPAGGTVLDPFMGSGSTLRAAKDCGLGAIGIEVEEEYCRRAAARMAQGVLFSLPRD